MENKIQEKEVWHTSGLFVVFLIGLVALFIAFVATKFVMSMMGVAIFIVPIALLVSTTIIQPNEACVYTFLGKYIGTLKKEGFYFTPPFAFKNKVSLKTMTLQNGIQKINDELGNPLEVGIVVIWKIKDTVKATLGVENYQNFLSTQSDSCLRSIISMYPYDSGSSDDKKMTLRGSNEEISETLQKEIQSKVDIAGIEILEAKINHLAYAPEIALAMLQRQQAAAIIDAKKLIVEGAVGMVDMALKEITKNNIVNLDDDKKAQMISNLLVVLCSNKDTQPVVNSSSS